MSILEQISIHAFIQENQIKTESGQPLDFHVHRFLFDIYRDNSKYLCCLKAAQIGFSTMAIIKTLWLARNRKMDIGYILPTFDDVRAFVGSKVNRICQQNKVLESWMKDKDAIEQKQIDESYIHYRGASVERAALMISLDMLVADEYDRSTQSILEIYDSRLQHSKYGYKWVFSNPSSPGFGVDKFWLKSDKKKWHITHACGKNFIMDEKCISYERELYICPHCDGEITDEERRMGEWVATDIGDWSGYWIPLWIAPYVSAKVICEYKKNKSSEYFANFVAGLPYVGSGNKVMPDTIIKCLSSKLNDQDGRIIIGVDTGLPIHYLCGNKQGIFYYGQCKEPSVNYDPYVELENLLIRWKSSILIADQGGDLIGIRRLQSKYPGRVFLVWYRTDRKTQQIITWGTGNEYGKVAVDRNRAIQMCIDEMVDKRVTFNGTEAEYQELLSHWMNIYRTWEDDALGQKVFKWERNGADHFVHCQVYWRVGMDKYAENLAQIIGGDSLSELPTGVIWNN